MSTIRVCKREVDGVAVDDVVGTLDIVVADMDVVGDVLSVLGDVTGTVDGFGDRIWCSTLLAWLFNALSPMSAILITLLKQ